MAVNDIRSDIQNSVALTAAISTDTTTNGSAIDTADFEGGLMFTVALNNFTDGTYNFTLQEATDSAFTTPVAIIDGSDKMIGTLAALTLTAASVTNTVLLNVGVISNLQFVRLNCVSTSTSTGADVLVICSQKGENMPVV